MFPSNLEFPRTRMSRCRLARPCLALAAAALAACQGPPPEVGAEDFVRAQERLREADAEYAARSYYRAIDLYEEALETRPLIARDAYLKLAECYEVQGNLPMACARLESGRERYNGDRLILKRLAALYERQEKWAYALDCSEQVLARFPRDEEAARAVERLRKAVSGAIRSGPASEEISAPSARAQSPPRVAAASPAALVPKAVDISPPPPPPVERVEAPAAGPAPAAEIPVAAAAPPAPEPPSPEAPKPEEPSAPAPPPPAAPNGGEASPSEPPPAPPPPPAAPLAPSPEIKTLAGLLAEGKYPEAEAHYKSAIETTQDGTLNFRAGALFLDHRRYPHATLALLRAIELDPENPEIYDRLGDVSMGEGKRDVAIQWYKRGLDIAPDHEGLKAKIKAAYQKK